MQQLPRSKPSPTVVHPSLFSVPVSLIISPTLQTDWEKKGERERERNEGNPPTILAVSRPRAFAPVYVSRARCLNGLVSSHLCPRLSLGSLFLILLLCFLLLLVVVLILAKCCDRHPPFVCNTPPFSLFRPNLPLCHAQYRLPARINRAKGPWGPLEPPPGFSVTWKSLSRQCFLCATS